MNHDLLNQLRDKYKRTAEKYGEKIFNIKELESRITHLMQTRGNYEMFFRAEMEFFEKTLALAKSKEEEIKKKNESAAKIDAILEKNLEKVKKYRDSFFDLEASVEVRKMVGAVSDWFDICFPLIKYIFRGADVWTEFTTIQLELERLYMPAGRPITAFLKIYVDDLKRTAANQKENTEKRLLQTCANSLYKMEKTLQKELEKMSDFQKNRFIAMSATFEPAIRDKWSKKKESEAIMECISGISAIIDDFRLRDLSALGFKNGTGN